MLNTQAIKVNAMNERVNTATVLTTTFSVPVNCDTNFVMISNVLIGYY